MAVAGAATASNAATRPLTSESLLTPRMTSVPAEGRGGGGVNPALRILGNAPVEAGGILLLGISNC